MRQEALALMPVVMAGGHVGGRAALFFYLELQELT